MNTLSYLPDLLGFGAIPRPPLLTPLLFPWTLHPAGPPQQAAGQWWGNPAPAMSPGLGFSRIPLAWAFSTCLLEQPFTSTTSCCPWRGREKPANSVGFLGVLGAMPGALQMVFKVIDSLQLFIFLDKHMTQRGKATCPSSVQLVDGKTRYTLSWAWSFCFEALSRRSELPVVGGWCDRSGLLFSSSSQSLFYSFSHATRQHWKAPGISPGMGICSRYQCWCEVPFLTRFTFSIIVDSLSAGQS